MVRLLISSFLYILTFSCFAQVEEIRQLLRDKPKTDQTAIWLCDTAFTFYRNNPKITQEIAELAYSKAVEWNADTARAKANHVIGISYWARDMYDSAIAHYVRALEFYEQLKMTRGIATINLNIGTIYDDLGESERGKPYLLSSLEVIRQLNDSLNLSRALNNTAVLYGNLNKPDSAITYFQECMKVRMAIKDSIGVARVYNNLADIKLFHEKEQELNRALLNEAHSYLIESLNYIDEGDDASLLATIYSNLGYVLVETKKTSEAIAYLERSEQLASEIGSKLRLQQIYSYYTKLYSDLGNYKLALEYYEKSSKLDQEQRSAEITARVDRLNIQYETEKKERLLAQSERKRAEERGLRNTIIISASSIIAIIGLLLFIIQQKRKKDRQIADLKLEHLTEEIVKKNKEIASYTLSFIQKNQIMDDLKANISELKKQASVDTNKQLTRINKIVDETFRSDEEWKTFQITFDQMHDGFFALLKEECPDLGSAELKLCALLRLNMNLKESARILGISPDSVKTARYRIRKKLGLKTEDNLVDYLIRFERDRSVRTGLITS